MGSARITDKPGLQGSWVGALQTPLGTLTLWWRDQRLVRLKLPPAAPIAGAVAVPAWLADDFAAYFRAPCHAFSVSTEMPGTSFQQSVWRHLSRIPVGSVRTYGELAAELGSCARAVGHACRANPCPIIVPCHRVVAKGGLGGFAGARGGESAALKAWLLRHEGIAGVEGWA